MSIFKIIKKRRTDHCPSGTLSFEKHEINIQNKNIKI